MKKLIGLLATFSIIASSSSIVVSCDKDNSWDVRPDKARLNPDLAKKLLASISGDAAIANMDFGAFFSSDQVTKIVVNMINELISVQYSFDSSNKMISDLGWQQKWEKDDKGGLEESFKNSYESNTRSIAQDNLFLEYTKALSNNENFDFNTQAKYLYDLNIVNETTVELIDGSTVKINPIDKENKYENVVFFKSQNRENKDEKFKVWKYSGEKIKNYDDQDQVSHMPNIIDLTDEYSAESSGTKTEFALDKDGKEKISAKTALYLRFQQYFESKLLEDINENLLTKSFLDANMFKVKQNDSEKGIYLNTASPIFSKTQSWSNNTNEKLKTNVKMVWSVKYDNTKKDLNLETELKSKLKDLIDLATGELKSDKSIKDIIKELNNLNAGPSSKADYTPYKDDKTSYDPYFGQGGFKGFTIYNNGTSIGDSPISGANFETAIKDWNHGPGVVFKSPEKYSFTDKDNGNLEEIVIVLPVYMVELLGGSSNDTKDIYKYKGKGSEDEKTISLGKSSSNNDEFKEIWNRDINKSLHSKDIQELINSENDKSGVKRNSILNQLKYLVSKDSVSTELAKTSLYSLYLDKDLVYYAGLYNEIGKYIKTEDDKDD
ncbi:hypothetical protein SLITO_v1c02200 [Spiroplasma litorale]|uniref:Lipoprotein n=1 Tax=Spiroplasma litorale TaxID=216942 RepID=A0A0K1W0P2_9MOLU|nr:lipoprotein [Spiroplasma litorale]AKX33879.1 hypothetical protein SLITO_v1c02200 [Spiroplasma litorale]